MKSAFVAGIVGLLVSYASAQTSPILSALLLMPKVIYQEDRNFFVLQLQNQNEDGSAKISIVDQNNSTIQYYEKTFPIEKANGPHFNLDISDLKVNGENQRNLYCTVILEGKFGETLIKENNSIRIEADDPLVLIQTDKKIYKPGQKVYLRVMPLSADLRPRNGGSISVSVNDPLNNVVANWADVKFDEMVMQFDFQLISEPAMGTWFINVRYEERGLPLSSNKSNPILQTAIFSVAEYTLPKFEVKITPPPYLLMDAKNATWKICANYTFGKPVNGDVKINTTLVRYQWENIGNIPENYVEARLVDGCYNLTLESSALNLTNPSFEYRQIRVLANVFEDGTKLQMNTTNRLSRTSMPLKLAFQPDSSDKYFRPYMNTYGSLKVSKPDDTPAPNEPLELCLTAKSETYKFHYQRTDIRLMCKNYTSDSEGVVKFTLPPHKPSVVSFTVEATSTRYPTKYFPENKYSVMIQQPKTSTSYRSFFSPSQQYLQFEPLSGDKLPCDKPVRLTAYYTFKENDKNLLFRYVVMGRSRNILSKEVVVATPTEVAAQANTSEALTETLPNTFSDMATASDKKIGRINIEVDPASTQLPQLTIALFYLNGTEVVADSIRVQRKVCSPNKVDLSFSENVVQPGANVTLSLTASANSQCGIQIVDRSVRLLSGSDNNPFAKYRDDLPSREIGQWEHPQPDTYGYCQNSGGQSDYVDSESVFLPAGWTAILYNINLKTRPCRSTREGSPDVAPEPRAERLYQSGIQKKSGVVRVAYTTRNMQTIALKVGHAPVAFSQAAFVAPTASRIGNDFGAATAAASQSVVDVRDYFPELWLFELSAVDGTGKLTRNLAAPHQVTTWNADAACIHKTDGLGVSPSNEIKTFQAFFADVTLPYSVKRLEVLPIVVSAYNYLPQCMPVAITIDPIPGLEARNPMKTEACVCADTSPFQYTLKVAVTNETIIGDLNVTVTVVNSENMSMCKDRPDAKSVPSRDKLTKPLKVIPEGFMVEKIDSFLLCPKSGINKADFNLAVPENVIRGSARSLFSVTGDIMGQSASNLESLIVLPTGGGEPNIAKFSSNLAILEYLNATGRLDSNVKNRIRNNLNKGYQNQLTFRGRDGSYSLWGGSWGQPSTFLSAMVYRGFKRAHNFIFIDDDGLTTTYNYLLSTQDKVTGCFNKIGNIYSWALRSSESSADTRGSYSAYVLAALHGSLTNKTRTEKALLCVKAQKNMNQHALALSAYAAALYNDTELANEYLTRLKAFENSKLPNQKFYYPSDSYSPQSIETSAYAVLAQLTLNGSEAIQQVQPIVRWLVKKQNRNGGFSSSQDTVIGLQALAKFAELTYKDQKTIDNKLAVKGQNFGEDYTINDKNAIIWDTRIVNTVPNDLTVTSDGSGCVVTTSQLRYNVPSVPGETGFLLNVTVTKASTVKNVVLELCASYDMTGGQPSSMAIIELTPFSGYNAAKPSLESILSRNQIKRFDAEGYSIILYFDEFTATPRCVTMELEQAFAVENLQPASAVVYDYYDKSKQKSVEYKRGELPSEKDNE